MKTESHIKWPNTWVQQGHPFVVAQTLDSPQGAQLQITSPLVWEMFQDPSLDQILNAEVLCAREIPVGASPSSSVYAGHQFGSFVPQLGDGRAVLLGEIECSGGRFELQFKGSGLTPYSRMGDGKAVLRSSIREFLMSEHMAALGVPTTRALSLCSSTEPVYRETVETAALVLRVAPSFLRFGHLEYYYHRGDHESLQKLLDYALDHHYAHLKNEAKPYYALLKEICERTAVLMAQWMALGWSHGVMNTDNMSLLGLTIDYGPFGFVEDFDPQWICNHSDHSGRYRLGAQASIGMWNCNALAWTFSPWLERAELESALHHYQSTFENTWQELLCAKVGVPLSAADLVDDLIACIVRAKLDWTVFWRQWSEMMDPVQFAAGQNPEIQAWVQRYLDLFPWEQVDPVLRRQKLCLVNPKYILRNHLAQKAIERAEKGDFDGVKDLLRVMTRPYEEQKGAEPMAQPSLPHERELQISCSS